MKKNIFGIIAILMFIPTSLVVANDDLSNVNAFTPYVNETTGDDNVIRADGAILKKFKTP